MADIEVVFLKSGESPDIGVYEVGQARPISEIIFKDFKPRGICKRKKITEPETVKPKKGVSGHGR